MKCLECQEVILQANAKLCPYCGSRKLVFWEQKEEIKVEKKSTENKLVADEDFDDDSTHSGMILASKILSDSSILTGLKDKYLVIYDQALTGLKFDNLNRAINVMAKDGWKCINITSYNSAGQAIFSQAIYMYALMEKLG